MAEMRACPEAVRGLANRWFQPLTHVSSGGFPRGGTTYGQFTTRDTRSFAQLGVSQCVARSVPPMFGRG